MTTVINSFIEKQNEKYAQINKEDYAKSLFKENVNVGEAIVNILSNTGIAGFKFNVPQREQVEMQSEVTDHYTDINRPIQDHIALKPITITLNGLHGEYFYSVNRIEDALAKVTPTLSLVKQFLPRISPQVMKAKMRYQENLKTTLTGYAFNMSGYSDWDGKFTNKEQSLIRKTALKDTLMDELNDVDLFQTMQDLYKLKSSQTRAFLFFEALWKSKARFTVETTWKRYDNMVITSVKPLRDENADITDFTLSFKQINRAVTEVTNLKGAAGRLSQQLAQTNKKGLDKGKEVKTI